MVDFSNGHLIVEELLVHWFQMKANLEATAPRQEFQNVIGKLTLIALYFRKICDSGFIMIVLLL